MCFGTSKISPGSASQPGPITTPFRILTLAVRTAGACGILRTLISVPLEIAELRNLIIWYFGGRSQVRETPAQTTRLLLLQAANRFHKRDRVAVDPVSEHE